MADQVQLPNETDFNAFAARVQEFRGTLPDAQQKMLDAMVHAAFKKDDDADVQSYWYAYPAAPGWYGAPSYYGTPWATSYGYGYRYW
jgi:hypothetical protein